ncbi:MAG: type II secretion system GspH family protein [Candidatus Sumerlaeia bacterium]|nr:type II secretion system GspH family protein [Candidatus Sumerlaeia bacterium]
MIFKTHNQVVESRAFSLFELLVVMAVIFILMIILMLSFSHLVVTTKITRVKEEQNILVRGLTNYHLDYGTFPPTFIGLRALSAPTAYLGSIPFDPFSPPEAPQKYFYLHHPDDKIDFIIISVGPDGDNDFIQLLKTYLETDVSISSNASRELSPVIKHYLEVEIYDPTNGIKSNGDIVYIRER